MLLGLIIGIIIGIIIMCCLQINAMNEYEKSRQRIIDWARNEVENE